MDVLEEETGTVIPIDNYVLRKGAEGFKNSAIADYQNKDDTINEHLVPDAGIIVGKAFVAFLEEKLMEIAEEEDMWLLSIEDNILQSMKESFKRAYDTATAEMVSLINKKETRDEVKDCIRHYTYENNDEFHNLWGYFKTRVTYFEAVKIHGQDAEAAARKVEYLRQG